MSNYISLKKRLDTEIISIEQKKFATYSNHLLTQDDKEFLKRKILSAEKIIHDIQSLHVGKWKIDKYIMKYVKSLMIFLFLQDICENLDFSLEYCLQYIREIRPKTMKYLEKILQSPDTWWVRIIPTDFLNILMPQMSVEVQEIAKDIFWERRSMTYHLKFNISSLKNQINHHTLPYKIGLIKRIGLWLSTQKIKRKDHGLISEEIISKILPSLEPWDIILTRWNWNLTNNSIPGFWKHMSIYVGHENICEAVWTGIQNVNIRHLLLKNDYCLVLRTGFSENKKQKAVAYVLKQVGNPYDFSFNYYCDTSAVCSALVTKAYLPENEDDEWLKIQLVWTNGAYTYSPNDFVKKMDIEEGTLCEQLRSIVFIDTNEKNETATIVPPIDARKTWKRSRWCLSQK